MRKCVVCGRHDREEVEALANQEGFRPAARRCGTTHQAIARHMRRHVLGVPLLRESHIDAYNKEETDDVLGLDAAADDGELAEALPSMELSAEDAAAQSRSPNVEPPQPSPSPTPTPEELATFTSSAKAYKARYPKVAALTTYAQRKWYLANLFRLGKFDGMRTSGHLSLLWDDLGPIEFAELVSQTAIEVNFRRGSEQARRVVLLGKVEQLFIDSVKAKDRRTAARLLETWAKLDNPVGVDLLSALANTESWPVVARELQQKYPEAFDAMYSVLVAEDARKRRVLAPLTVESSQDAE